MKITLHEPVNFLTEPLTRLKGQTTKLLFVLLTGVGVGDLVGLIGVQPDLLLAAA